MKSLSLSLIFVCSAVLPAQTTVLFDTATPGNGLFPSDAFSTPDSSQKTGERVSLPASVALSPLLNQLDGFSVNPRITVCFSAAVNTATTAANISFYPVGNSRQPIAVNQVIYDPAGSQQPPISAPPNCIYAKPQQVLAETTQYLLVVTNGILDNSGNSVAPAPAYTACINGRATSYCNSLAQALNRTNPAGTVIGASLFTTMSSTAWLESAKKFVNASQLPVVLPAGLPFEFSLSNLSNVTWYGDTGSGPPIVQPIPLSSLANVDKVAFGFFLSPNFLGSDGTIAAQPTNSPVTAPVPAPTIIPGISFGYLPISFHLFLPPQSAVRGGRIPVVIYGHGLGDTQFGAPTYIASTLAKNGYATLAIEIPGHGYGPLSTVTVTTRQNATFTMLTPGRGVLLPGNTSIGPTDGCVIPTSVAVRDCARQAAVDLMALVRTITLTNGLGLNLDPTQIYYVGQSFGVTYGTLFNAVEPEITAAVLNSGGGTSVDVARLAIPERPFAEYYLSTFTPPLLNVAAGLAPPEPYFNDAFNDNYVFPSQPVVTTTNNVAGAIPIQNAFESIDWLGMPGDPLAFAAMLRTTGNPVLVQFSYGDLEVPNPTESALIRAAGLQSSSWYLHFDAVLQIDPSLATISMPGIPFILPHRLLSNPTLADPSNATENVLANALQNQVVGFLNSNGRSIPNPNQFLQPPFSGQNPSLFQLSPDLPEGLNFLQIQP